MGIYVECSKEIYDFLTIVNNNQMFSKKEEINYVIHQISYGLNDAKKEKELDDKYHNLMRIDTDNGYIEHMGCIHNNYYLAYQTFLSEVIDKEDLPYEEIDSIYRDINLLKEDLINLGFSGDVNGIYF